MPSVIDLHRSDVDPDAIPVLLAGFYDRVRRDPELGPVFANAIGNTDAAWTAHLARLGDFWSSVMHTTGRYHGDPFSAHLRLPDLTPALFDRWLALFRESCTETLPPEAVAAFISRAERIARSLQMGLFERMPTRPA